MAQQQLDAMLLAQRRLAGAAREFASRYDAVAEAKSGTRGGWSALVPPLLAAQTKLGGALEAADKAVAAYGRSGS